MISKPGDFSRDPILYKMGVNEEDVVNIMGGMEHAGGIKLNDHKRKLKNR